MSDTAHRALIPFTNEHFAAFVQKMVGQPYWYGTCLYNCTESLRSRKAKQYESHYGASRTATYKKHIAAKMVCGDCIGGAKGYAWTNGGQGVLEAIGTGKTIAQKYGSNNCPDKGATGMFTYAKSKGRAWGVIGTLPEIVGLALHKDGHVGYYIGNGRAVEWKGFAYGCVISEVKGRGWTHWYELPFVNYGDATVPETPDTPPAPTTYTLGSRLLKRGMAGNDVKALQELLMQLGYALPSFGADGDYGAETEAAVMNFQCEEELEEDGKYGNMTHAALMNAVADHDEGQKDGPDASDDTPTTPADPPAEPTARFVEIVNTSGTVNIRTGNGTNYGRITAVKNGTKLPYVATAANGWHAVVINGQVGWVSGNYSVVRG